MRFTADFVFLAHTGADRPAPPDRGIGGRCSPAAQGAPRPKLQAFDLRDVVLLDGPFKHATDQDRAYLLSLEPDRLLAWFRKEAGLAPKAAVYGGWESEKLAGHSLDIPVGLRPHVPRDQRRALPRPHHLHRG